MIALLLDSTYFLIKCCLSIPLIEVMFSFVNTYLSSVSDNTFPGLPFGAQTVTSPLAFLTKLAEMRSSKER